MHEIFEKWMNRCQKVHFGIILPDGWMGRPYDALHKINSYEWVGNQISILFNTTRTINVSGSNVKCRIERVGEMNEELIIYDFDEFEIRAANEAKPLYVYRSGELTIVGYYMHTV
jgi:hypothetical protein